MILTYPNSILRVKCEKVASGGSKIRDLVKTLNSSLSGTTNGAGLSAPQIGSNLRVFVIKTGHNLKVVANPQIIDNFGMEKSFPEIEYTDNKHEDFLEGCLSFPGVFGTVKRWLKIGVKYQTLTDDDELVDREEVLENMDALVFQHESDHLDGILFIDHVKKDKGRLYKEEGKNLVLVSVESFYNM